MVVDKFQYTVQDLLVRNKSIIDQLTKFQDSNSRVNRTIVKAVTQCGCIQIDAHRQPFDKDGAFEDADSTFETHLSGTLCDNCRDQIEKEIGSNLFYMASLCNTLDLNLYDIMIKELERAKMLGKYNMR
jgi:hypothetical protein